MTTWPIRAFAQLTGVTVKALHHYERRGLLAPQRSAAGYRRYSLRDLERLERVLALKSLGLPLGEIARVIDPEGDAAARQARRPAASFEALRAQREPLVQLRDRLDRAIAALDAINGAPQPAAALDRFVRESAWARWESRRAAMASPAPRAPDRASPSRVALFGELAAALQRDPSGASARPLAARWHALITAEADGNVQTVAALRMVSRSRASWPDGARRYIASLYDADVDTWERVMTFIEHAD